MKLFMMLVGIPGSGKSSLARDLAQTRQAVIVSTDAIRKEITGKETDFSRDDLVFTTVLSRIKELIAAGANVVYDATNLTPADRKRILKIVPPETYKTCYFRKVPLAWAINRNLNRERVVPVEVIARMSQKLREPSYQEGWDQINIIEPK